MARRSEYKVLNMRVTPVARQLLAEIAEDMGISQTAVVETLIRDAARVKGLASLSRQSQDSTPAIERISHAIEAAQALGSMGPSGKNVSDDALSRAAIYADHP